MLDPLLSLDASILQWISALPHPAWLTFIMNGVTISGDGSAIWFALALVVAWRRDPESAFRVALSLIVTAVVVGNILKPSVSRNRPALTAATGNVVAVRFDSPSFPSGHAAGAAAGAYSLGRVWLARAPLVWSLAVLIAVSRVYLERFSNRPCTTWGGRGTSARTDAGGLMRASSMDLRERVLLDSDAGMKAADVAAKYRVSGSWVRLLKQRRRETGEVAPRVQRHGRRCMLEPHLHTLADLIAAQPDRTLAELKDALATPASVPTVWRAVRALGLTVKKNGPPVRTRSA